MTDDELKRKKEIDELISKVRFKESSEELTELETALYFQTMDLFSEALKRCSDAIVSILKGPDIDQPALLQALEIAAGVTSHSLNFHDKYSHKLPTKRTSNAKA